MTSHRNAASCHASVRCECAHVHVLVHHVPVHVPVPVPVHVPVHVLYLCNDIFGIRRECRV